VHLMIGPQDLLLVQEKFGPTRRVPALHRYHRRLKVQKFFAKLTSLGPSNLEQTCIEERIEWGGTHGWFDECVRIARRRARYNRYVWTGSELGADDKESKGERIPDSYCGMDHSLWDRQQERDLSLTLDADQQGRFEQFSGDGEVRNILQVLAS
jgi:hypothetical protein